MASCADAAQQVIEDWMRCILCWCNTANNVMAECDGFWCWFIMSSWGDLSNKGYVAF